MCIGWIVSFDGLILVFAVLNVHIAILAGSTVTNFSHRRVLLRIGKLLVCFGIDADDVFARQFQVVAIGIKRSVVQTHPILYREIPNAPAFVVPVSVTAVVDTNGVTIVSLAHAPFSDIVVGRIWAVFIVQPQFEDEQERDAKKHNRNIKF